MKDYLKLVFSPFEKITRQLSILYSGLGTSDTRAGGRRNLTFENPVYTNDMYNVHRDADRNIQVLHHVQGYPQRMRLQRRPEKAYLMI